MHFNFDVVWSLLCIVSDRVCTEPFMTMSAKTLMRCHSGMVTSSMACSQLMGVGCMAQLKELAGLGCFQPITYKGYAKVKPVWKLI